MKWHSLKIETRDVKRSDSAREELLAGGGNLKVPFLQIEDAMERFGPSCLRRENSKPEPALLLIEAHPAGSRLRVPDSQEVWLVPEDKTTVARTHQLFCGLGNLPTNQVAAGHLPGLVSIYPTVTTYYGKHRFNDLN